MCDSSENKLKPKYLNCCVTAVMISISLSTYAQSTEQSLSLPVITVYAAQEQKVPESITTIDHDNLIRMGITDMASIVKYQPLVSAPKAVNGSGNAWDGAGTSGYNIRGVEGNRVGLDVDGVELASATPEPDSLKGNSFSSGRDFGEVKGGYSSADDAWFSSITTAVGSDRFKGLVVYSHRDGHATQSESKLRPNPVDWSSDAILAKLLWNINERHSLGTTFDFYKKDTHRYISTDLLSSLYPRGASQEVDGQRIRYSLDDLYTPENLSLFDQLKSTIYYQATKNNNKTYMFYAGKTGQGYRTILNDYTEDNLGLNLNAQKALNIHRLEYGLTLNQINSNRPWQQYNPDGSVTTQNRMVKSTTNKYAFYISDAMTWSVFGKPFGVTPGLRYQFEAFKPENTSEVLTSTAKQMQVSSKDNHYLAPSIAISYQLSPNYYSYLKYNRGNRIPTAAEMSGSFDPGRGYSIIGNSQLKKEESDAFELGLKTTPLEGIKLDLTGFYTQYHNFIDYKQLSTAISGDTMMTYQLQNIASANIWGGEVSAHIDLSKFISSSEGFSLSLVAGTTKGSAKNSNGQKTGINSIQPKKASLTLGYDDPKQQYGLGFTSTAVASKRASQDASIVSSGTTYPRVAGYVVHDLSAYWKPTSFITVNLSLNNIFDKKYWDYATVGTLTSANLIDRATLPGRNVVASLAFKF